MRARFSRLVRAVLVAISFSPRIIWQATLRPVRNEMASPLDLDHAAGLTALPVT